MDTLLVFGSEDCLGWDETQEVFYELENDPDFSPSITYLDPIEHEEKFRHYGLVVCPSVVYKNIVIAVGPPDPESIKVKVNQLT